MLGKIKSISHDRLLDEPTHQYYYLGVVSLNRADIPEEYRSRVRAGMPAEIAVSSGERTVLNYLVGPLFELPKKNLPRTAGLTDNKGLSRSQTWPGKAGPDALSMQMGF